MGDEILLDLEGVPGVDHWRLDGGRLHGGFDAATFADAGRLVAAIADAADDAEHHPDVELRYPGRVLIAMTTHDVGGVTRRDIDLARTISTLAEQSGATASPPD